jgi:hypothetical protein
MGDLLFNNVNRDLESLLQTINQRRVKQENYLQRLFSSPELAEKLDQFKEMFEDARLNVLVSGRTLQSLYCHN